MRTKKEYLIPLSEIVILRIGDILEDVVIFSAQKEEDDPEEEVDQDSKEIFEMYPNTFQHHNPWED